MKTAYVTILSFVLLFTKTLHSEELKAKELNIITPSIGLGDYRLGKSTLKEILGNDSGSIRSEFFKKGLMFQFNQGKELTGITIMSMDFKTDKGISVGDTLQKVQSIYGNSSKPKEIKEKHGKFTINAASYEGISFLIDKDQKVFAIHISSLTR
jgi:hypothetical protein